MAENVKIDTENNDKNGKTKLIIIIVAVVLLLLVVGGGLFYFLGSNKDEASEETSSTENLGSNVNNPAIYLNLDPAFVVDFNIAGKQRYLQLDLTLKSRSQEQIHAVQIHMPLIRNSLVLLFSSQDFDELRSPEGKEQLKTAAIDAINAILLQETGVEGIESVLFTNFVMQ